MSFIKDLMAWRRRNEDEDDWQEQTVAQTDPSDEDDWEDDEDWEDDDDLLDEDEDQDDDYGDEDAPQAAALPLPPVTLERPAPAEPAPRAAAVPQARAQTPAAPPAPIASPPHAQFTPRAAGPAAAPGVRPTAESQRPITTIRPASLDNGDMSRLIARVQEGSQAPAPRPAAPAASAPRAEQAAKIWDMPAAAPRAVAPEPAPVRAAPAAPDPVGAFQSAATPEPQPRPAGGRVKTRLLGFHAAATPDPFQAPASDPTRPVMFPTGWIVVVKGQGRGAAFTLGPGVNQIGRGDDQSVRLDFGDSTISRQNHAAIAYDEEAGRFFLGHGGKSNLVRLNGRPVLSTEALSDRDMIRIGETTLRFVALCGNGFSWSEEDAGGEAGAGGN